MRLPSCPCGSPATIKHGAKARRFLRISDGCVGWAECEASRYLCKDCGRTFTRLPEHALDGARQVRDHVAELTFRLGRAAAARRTGLKPDVVDRLLKRWRDAREPDVSDAAPDFLVIDEVRLRDARVILVADLDRESLVETSLDPAALSAWLRRPGIAKPTVACVPVDASLAGAVRGAVPGITLMIAPAALLRAIRGALAAGLRALGRAPGMARRNAFPGTARFLRAFDGRVAPGDGWPLEVMGLLTAGRAARDVACAADAATGERAWPEFELAVATPGGAPLARLMSTWRDGILAGLDHRFVDRVCSILTDVRRAATARRPPLLARDFRGLALLRDCERGSLPSGHPNAGQVSLACGRPLAGLAALLGGHP